jgi:predicted permease
MDAALRAQETNTPPAPAVKSGPPPNRVVLVPATAVSSLRRQFSRPLFVLLAMVGVVLLTACANTANLLLARGAARRPEFAMRLALGAARGRLMRQLLIESVALAALGGMCGVLLARWATQLLVVYMSSGRTPIVMDLTPNLRILAFTAAASVLTGLLFGLAPAWRATRIDLTPALKNVRSSLSRSLRPGRVLAIAQLALSLLLLVAAGLFVRSLQNLNGKDMGVPRQSVLILRVEPRGSDQRGIPGTTERLDRTYRELMRRAREIPGVEQASMANSTPTLPLSSASAPVPLPSGERARVPMLMVYPNYFATVGMPIVSGRDFGPADLSEQAPGVCIVNEAFVRRVFLGENPIGRPCYTGRRARLQSTTPQMAQTDPFQIVGMVRDSRYTNPRGETQPLIYMTFLQANTGRGQMLLHLRVTGNAGLVVQRVREEVAAIDPAMPMFDVHTLEEEMNAALVQQRLIAMLSTLFGALALLLACVGLYGLLSFTLVQRTSEMGIRMALGARRRDVVWLVLSDALLLVLMGIAIGVPAALAVARLAANQISGLLFGLNPADPAILVVAALVLGSVAAIAAYLPARRASRVDPMVVLRME